MRSSITNSSELREYIAQLKRRQLNFSAEPDIQLLLQEQERRSKAHHEKSQALEDTKEGVGKVTRLIRMQQDALKNPRSARELNERQEQSQKRLLKLEQLNAPLVIIENEKRMVWEVTAPLEALMNHHALKQQLVAQAVEDVKQAATNLAEQQELYRCEKKRLQQTIAEAEAQLLELNRSSAVALPSQGTGQQEASNGNGHRPTLSRHRRKQQCKVTVTTTVTPTKATDAWQYIYVADYTKPGLNVPGSRVQFMATLKPLLINFPRLDAGLVYDKLYAITKMTVQQRQLIHKLVNCQPEGWKIARCGQRHRLFLDIDEEKRLIKFMVEHRKHAYGNH